MLGMIARLSISRPKIRESASCLDCPPNESECFKQPRMSSTAGGRCSSCYGRRIPQFTLKGKPPSLPRSSSMLVTTIHASLSTPICTIIHQTLCSCIQLPSIFRVDHVATHW
jgi:hypothetical protein